MTVVAADGAARRSAVLPLWEPVGEIEDAVVGASGLWSWSGEKLEPPIEGTPIGVLNGRQLVLAGDSKIDVADIRGKRVGTCGTPPEATFGIDVQYDALATRLAATAWNNRGVLVVTNESGPRWIPLDFVPYHPVWLGEEQLLLFELAAPSTAVVLDLASGTTTPLALPRRAPIPRVDVTRRFNPEEIRAVLRPAHWTPPTPDQRDAALALQRTTLESETPARLRSFIGLAMPTVRLRACLPPRRPPLGGSRLGGRPDLPPTTRWPTTDGRPLAFLAQLRLEEVAPAAPDGAMPPAGLLHIFVDLESDGMYPASDTAIHAAIVEASTLKRAAWPKSLPAELRFDPAVLVPEPSLSLPTYPQSLPEDDAEAWAALVDRVTPRAPHHRMLGYPVAIQDLGPPADRAVPKVLLMQIDGDGISGMAFGDGGSLQIWASAQGLVAGELSHCTIELDSY